MDDINLGLLCERGAYCHCFDIENYMLSCYIVIHTSASNWKALLLKIIVLLRTCKKLLIGVKFFVLFFVFFWV